VEDIKPWQPHPGPQTEFCKRGEFEVFFGGAKGPGKTDCLIAEAARYVFHPKYHGLLLRRTFPRLQEIIDRCWLLYPTIGGEYRAGEHRWYFPGGGKVTLGHAQHEQDKYNYHGKEFHFLGFDELTEFDESTYLFIIANVRRSVSDLRLRIRATSNPGGRGHAWVKERFVDTCEPKIPKKYIGGDGDEHETFIPEVYIDPASGTSRCFVPATVYDNPSIIINDPLYVRRLELLPELEKKRFLYGVWDIFEGQVFTELTQHTHGCEDFPIPPDWEKIMVFDWGYSRPWCALWFAIDYDGVIYLYREHYGMVDKDPNKGVKQTNTEICREIQKKETEKIGLRISDPACWGPTKIKGSNMVLGPSFVDDAAIEGLFFLKADNDRLRGKQQLHQRFKLDVTLSDEGEVIEEVPKFVAFNSCKRWWEEMQSLYEDPKNTEDVDCFVSGTLIETVNGSIPIEYIKIGDYVKTPIGNREVIKSNISGLVKTTKVFFKNGESIEATSDHKIFIKKRGLIPLCMVSSNDETITKEELCQQKKLITGESLSKNIQKDDILSAIRSIADISEQHCSTGQFGKTSMGKYLKDILSTIKTTTQQTTILEICNSFLRVIMQDTTMKKELKPVTILGLHKLNGGKARVVKRFLEAILKNAVKTPQIENLRALIVANLLIQEVQEKGSVALNVDSKGKKLNKDAQSVGKPFWQKKAGKGRKRLVVDRVVSNLEIKPVFNITVKQAHMFFANRALVTNTDQPDEGYDCTRYLSMSRPITPTLKTTQPQGTFQAERKRLIRAKTYSKRHGVSLATAYGNIR